MPRARRADPLDAEDQALLAEAVDGPLKVYSLRGRRPAPGAAERLERAEALCRRGLLRFHARRGSRDDPWGDEWREYDLARNPPRPFRNLRDPTGRYH